MAEEPKVPLPEYIYISKVIETYGEAQLKLLRSISSSLTFIVIVIIIGIAIQVLSSCMRL